MSCLDGFGDLGRHDVEDPSTESQQGCGVVVLGLRHECLLRERDGVGGQVVRQFVQRPRDHRRLRPVRRTHPERLGQHRSSFQGEGEPQVRPSVPPGGVRGMGDPGGRVPRPGLFRHVIGSRQDPETQFADPGLDLGEVHQRAGLLVGPHEGGVGVGDRAEAGGEVVRDHTDRMLHDPPPSIPSNTSILHRTLVRVKSVCAGQRICGRRCECSVDDRGSRPSFLGHLTERVGTSPSDTRAR